MKYILLYKMIKHNNFKITMESIVFFLCHSVVLKCMQLFSENYSFYNDNIMFVICYRKPFFN